MVILHTTYHIKQDWLFDATVPFCMEEKRLLCIFLQFIGIFLKLLHDQGNVDSTKKTYDETEEVVDTFKQVYVSAEQLREIADELVSSIDYFKMQ